MNTKLRQKVKNNFQKDFFKLMNNAVFRKALEKQKYQTCNNKKEKKLFSISTKLPNYKVFHRKIISNKNEKNSNIIKPFYLGLSILDLSKTLMYDFWYDYVKPKYGENAKLCFIDTDNFIVHVKRDDIYKDIAEDIETR